MQPCLESEAALQQMQQLLDLLFRFKWCWPSLTLGLTLTLSLTLTRTLTLALTLTTQHRVEQPAVAQCRQLPHACARHGHGHEALAQTARLDAHLRQRVVLAVVVVAQLLLGRLPPG